jgi:hypothetical protein
MPPQSDWTSADLLGDLLAACYRRLLVQAAIEETPITDESLGGDDETGDELVWVERGEGSADYEKQN